MTVDQAARAGLEPNGGARRAEARPSTRSQRGRDGINLLMADVRDGVGRYLLVFLKGGEHWDSGAIGIAMAASSIAAQLVMVGVALMFFAVLMPETKSAESA